MPAERPARLGETATMKLPEACELLGISLWQGYALVKRNEFPVPALRLGQAIRIPRQPLLELLGIGPST